MNTPTPWKVEITPKRNVYIKRGIDNIAQAMYGAEDIDPEANAAFMVQAVNSHDQLVAALRLLVEDAHFNSDLKGWTIGPMSDVAGGKLDMAKKALAQAEMAF